VTLKGDPAADIEKQTRDAFERRADTIVNSASQANHAQYVQAVVDSLVERGLASTFRADGDPLGQVDDVARREQPLEPLDGALPVGVAGGAGEQGLLAVGGDVLDRRPGRARATGVRALRIEVGGYT